MAVKSARRVVIGRGPDGSSTIVRDDEPQSRVTRLSGSMVEELWRVDSLPFREGDEGATRGELAPLPPRAGLSVRRFSIPPGTGEGDPPGLTSSDALFLLVVVHGAAVLVLEDGAVALSPGDFVALPGYPHGWRNPHEEECVIVTTVVPMTL